jgi:hypothetical protein
MVFNVTFNNISAISCCQVFLWRKPEYPEKTTDLFFWKLSIPFPLIATYYKFSGCWLILSVYIPMSFDFLFVRLFGVRQFCYYPYLQRLRTIDIYENLTRHIAKNYSCLTFFPWRTISSDPIEPRVLICTRLNLHFITIFHFWLILSLYSL